MATKIRLLRRGRKKYARFDIVVADSRSPRDGKFIEKIGLFNPHNQAAPVELNADRAFYWIMTGATPTETARTILSTEGIMLKKHLQVGVNKGAITQDQADKKFQEWKTQKEKAAEDKNIAASDKKAADKKARLAAEAKVSEARKLAQIEKAKPAEEAPAAVESAPEASAPEENSAE